ncbi:DUF4233 domain-containing protein [uncultured Tessaracoccus sp.]|uniref:DUF4233 domain-containing protein n=1 Tax=uncultured Tessaracoccus sp. TaxID=905023 RepID=UPI002612B254|nr:DUF4233 domain-containing protein [uncultured Tessaracoccus sp.]
MRLDPTNPMNASMRALLVFELIVAWLSFPGMLQVAGADVSVALAACTAETLLLVAAAGGIKKPWGYPVGWAGQAGLLLLGLLTWWMYVMGAIFALLWITSYVLGKRIEAKKEAQ